MANSVRIYKIKYHGSQGVMQIFAPNKSGCGRIRKELRKIHGHKSIISTEAVDFPTNQGGIIDYLNGCCKHAG